MTECGPELPKKAHVSIKIAICEDLPFIEANDKGIRIYNDYSDDTDTCRPFIHWDQLDIFIEALKLGRKLTSDIGILPSETEGARDKGE